MEDLVLAPENTMEENILAIIDFVKQVEKGYGLTEEQIIYKYTCGGCYILAYEIVIKTLEKLFGEVKGLYLATFKPSSYLVDLHRYAELKDYSNNEEFYFDILGKKSKEEVKTFINSNFWEEQLGQPWVEKFKGSYAMVETDYVIKECDKHIKTDGVTVL